MVPDAAITIDYPLSYRDFVAGYKLGVRQSLPALVMNVFATYIASALAVLFFAIALTNVLSGHASLVAPLVPIILLCSLLPFLIWFGRRNSFKRLKGDAQADPQMTFRADRTSFARQIHTMGEVTWLWSATRKIIANETVVLISVNRSSFIVIPRRLISEAQLAQLRDFLLQAKASDAN